MTTVDPLFAYKGQARRLALALRDLQLSVSHSQALDLIGRVHGKRNWNELAGVEKSTSSSDAVDDVALSAELTYLEYWLRLRGVTEMALDDMVHDLDSPEQASNTNNAGLFYQLRFLLVEGCNGSIEKLYQLLAENADVPGTLNWARPAVPAKAWASDQFTVTFDALPWLLQCKKATLSQLVNNARNGAVGNCDIGDFLAYWTKTHGRHEDARKLSEVYSHVAAAQTLDSDNVGITVEVNVEALRKYIELRRDQRLFSDDFSRPMLSQLDELA